MGTHARQDPGAKKISSPPYVHSVEVSPGSIKNAETRILREADSQIAAYEDLKSYVEQVAPWIFTSKYPVRTDPEPHVTETMSRNLHNALVSTADAIELVGQLVALLNWAAQGYAGGDEDSFLPSMDVHSVQGAG
jgi:hypothetical protein